MTKQFNWTPSATTSPGDYVVTIEAEDSQGAKTTKDVVITVEEPAPEIQPGLSGSLVFALIATVILISIAVWQLFRRT